jgi:hypothetical protein
MRHEYEYTLCKLPSPPVVWAYRANCVLCLRQDGTARRGARMPTRLCRAVQSPQHTRSDGAGGGGGATAAPSAPTKGYARDARITCGLRAATPVLHTQVPTLLLHLCLMPAVCMSVYIYVMLYSICCVARNLIYFRLY